MPLKGQVRYPDRSKGLLHPMMASSSSTIREEILELSNTFTLFSSRLLQLAKRVEQQDQDTATWKGRYADLEVAYGKALTSNTELERKVASHKPEVNVERDDAWQKLKHARKVIRDLIDERGDMKSPRAPIVSEDIDRALYGEFQRSEDSPSTDSQKTTRLASSPKNVTVASSSQESHESDRVRTRSNASEESLPDAESVASLSPQASQISTQSLEEEPHMSSGGPLWRIHYKKPPGTSVVTEGPISALTLENDLGLEISSLQNLADSSDFSARFEVLHLPSKHNVAFLYDPLFLEATKQSYILDWGYRQTNVDLGNYITRYKDIDSVFHTFTFPVKEGGWFYIGAQHWSVVDFEKIWPLEGKSRKAIIKKLFKRSQGKVNETEVAKLLDSDELVQFCVELTAVADMSTSQDFSRDVLGYRTPPRLLR